MMTLIPVPSVAIQELLPVQSVDWREQIRRSLDEANERSHRQRHAAEIVVVKGALSDADTLKLQGYFTSKFGL